MTDYIEPLEPEWNHAGSVAVDTFLCEGKVYTVSTVSLSSSPMPYFTSFLTALGDNLTGNEEDTHKDYETMLFIDGNSNDGVYPFGDMPGNELQGVYQRYETREEAEVGHRRFVEEVKAVLLAPIEA